MRLESVHGMNVCLRVNACPLVILGEPETGFEPVTPCLQDRCSGQLSYSGVRTHPIVEVVRQPEAKLESGRIDDR